jgi:multidrug transporter EmrE-like cation transporter
MPSPTTVKYLFFSLLAASLVFEVVADILLKKWSLNAKTWALVIGLGLYFIGTVFWAFSLRHEVLSKAVSIFTVLNLVLVVLAGVIVFDDHLTTANKIGVALGICSVILLEM